MHFKNLFQNFKTFQSFHCLWKRKGHKWIQFLVFISVFLLFAVDSYIELLYFIIGEQKL